MSRTKLFAVAATISLAMLAFAPATVGAQAAVGNTALSIGVSQGAAQVTVSVSNATNGSPVANATVNISSDGNYSVTGMTDEDGTVAFELPNETVNATITAETNATNATKTVTLRAHEGQGPSFLPFGQRLTAYIDSLTVGNGPLGLLVADFAADDGGPPADAGPPDHAGPPGDDGGAADAGNESNATQTTGQADGNDERGPPDHAGPQDKDVDDQEVENEDNGERGPPDHAGPEDKGDDAAEEKEDDDEDAEDGASDARKNGNGNGNGHGQGNGNDNGNGNGNGNNGNGNGNN